ncbi:MAG: type II secretion system protein GspE, partial [Candidatus Hydrogenedentes bacterium]|nr:type II secretion system protein GspE [Candidatus Hydrogenedentota bacterium]
GEMLMEAGVISQDQLDSALAAQADSPDRSLAEILVDQGAVGEEVVAQAAAAQHRVLYVNLNDNSVDPAAAALISFKIAQQHHCVPVRATEDSLVLAMADPLNVIAIEDVERASSRSVRPVMATQSAIAAAIDRVYQTHDEQVK